MKGLELAKRYYEELAVPAIREHCPEALAHLAAGLVGEGSDCFGFDDAVSRDHDWGPGFCIWLTEEDDAAYGAALREVYAGLSGTYREFSGRKETPEGAGRVGVMTVGSFYRRYVGWSEGPSELRQWLAVPESYLATATNGTVFQDPVGAFSRIRERLLAFYPEDVRRKKIAAKAAHMGQAGQYNYQRCLLHGEVVGAQLALDEFVREGMAMVYLLNRRYMPFYKWAHRGMQQLEILHETGDLFRKLCGAGSAHEKTEIIETISGMVLQELVHQGICSNGDDFLLTHCQEIMQGIQDPQIRAMHFLQG